MQRDGNFVLQSNNDEAIWATGTENHPGSNLIFGESCSILIRSPQGSSIWNSPNTCGNI